MGMSIILGWLVSLLENSSREERRKRLTQFSSTRVFLIQARNDWQQLFHLVLVITQPERKTQALLLPSHCVDSWGCSEVACRGRPWEAWQNPLRKWLQKEQAHLSHLGPGPWQLVIYLLHAYCSGYVAGVLSSMFLSLGRGWFKVSIYKSVLGIHCYMMWFIPVGLHMWKKFDVSLDVYNKKIFAIKRPDFQILFHRNSARS